MQTDWLSPLSIPVLPPDSVHIWSLALNQQNLAQILSIAPFVLSADEIARAKKIRIPAVCNQFLAARTLLRTILAGPTGQPAASLVFAYGPAGKPYLPSHPHLAFNLSHAANFILIALTQTGTVGVDITSLTEHCIAPEELLQIAHDTFPPSIAAQLTALPIQQRLHAFYRAWTIREAVAKADGRGIASPLKYRQFDSDQPKEALIRLEPADSAAPSVQYRVHTFQLGASATAAIALSQPRQSLRLLDAARLPWSTGPGAAPLAANSRSH